MKVLVGSKALAEYIPINRKIHDIDYFTNEQVPRMIDGVRVETFFHPALARWFSGRRSIASLNELYTIKVSHQFWELKNGSWDKHMFDIGKMKCAGATLIPEFFDILYPIWEETHGKKRVNLEQEPEEFFNGRVKRKYEHDSLHASVAYYDEPLFNRILRDGHRVAVDKEKFFSLSHEDKLKLVREEVYVLALERYLIPFDYKESALRAYAVSLKKTITQYSKGFFALWVVEHYDELRRPDLDYVQKHKDNSHRLVEL